MFAKLYETEEYGQLLVKLDNDGDEGGAEVRIYFQPEGYGVCSTAFDFSSDENSGWGKAKAIFNAIDIDQCKEIIDKSFAELLKNKPERKQ